MPILQSQATEQEAEALSLNHFMCSFYLGNGYNAIFLRRARQKALLIQEG